MRIFRTHMHMLIKLLFLFNHYRPLHFECVSRVVSYTVPGTTDAVDNQEISLSYFGYVGNFVLSYVWKIPEK